MRKVSPWTLRVKSILLRTALPKNQLVRVLNQNEKKMFLTLPFDPIKIILSSTCARGNLGASAFLQAHFINEVSVLTGNKSEDEASCSTFPWEEKELGDVLPPSHIFDICLHVVVSDAKGALTRSSFTVVLAREHVTICFTPRNIITPSS